MIAGPAAECAYGRRITATWCSESCVCVMCLNLDLKLDYAFTALFVAPDVLEEAA